MPKKRTNWTPKDGDEADRKSWTHTGAHVVADDEVDGTVEFPEELKEKEREQSDD
ncbi:MULTISPECIES: hypothetical protein [Natrialbaceae]|uniref:hypothetical protein n=1 Tax=Natrialbaceae TaxID=1644061 RepID=UPI00207C3833|nr:hypothetical protein [Natronococcus sp. CG52]